MRTICVNQGPFECPKSVATIGVFDGVHAGHQLLIRKVCAEARSLGLCSMVITFDRQPRQLFDASYHPQVLTTLEEKKAIIEALGVDIVVVLPFTKGLATLTAYDFMQQVLRLPRQDSLHSQGRMYPPGFLHNLYGRTLPRQVI